MHSPNIRCQNILKTQRPETSKTAVFLVLLRSTTAKCTAVVVKRQVGIVLSIDLIAFVYVCKICLNSDPTILITYAEGQRHARLENTL